MALPLGKLTILVGAGLLGSVLAKEGRISDVSNFVSGAFKIVFKQLKQDESTKSASKSHNPHKDSLLAQVNSLRQELQLLASNRSITIVATSGAGGRKYGVIVVIVVVGCGYVWWKGWKLPDFMFATRRSLSEACNSIAKQLESVYSSISATRRQLSSKIDKVDASLDEIEGVTRETGREVSELRDGATRIGEDVRSVRYVVETLESKISRIEGKQDVTTEGVRRLCDFTQNLEHSRTAEPNQALPSSSSRLSLEAAPETPSSRTASLPPVSPREPHSPSASNGSHKFRRQLHHAVSSSGLKGSLRAAVKHRHSLLKNQAMGPQPRRIQDLGNQQEYLKLKARYEALQRSQRRRSRLMILNHLRDSSHSSLKQTRSLRTRYKLDQFNDLQHWEHRLNETKKLKDKEAFQIPLQLNQNAEDVGYGRLAAHPHGNAFSHSLDCEPILQIGFLQQDSMTGVTEGSTVNHYMPGWTPINENN